jgi:acetyl esterase/lipase
VRHAYGPHPHQFGELRLPDGDGPFGVCVLVHGGGWSVGYDLSLMAALAADLPRRGWAAWNLEYRRVGPRSGGGWPQTGEDVRDGIAALRALAAGGAPLDLDRVVVCGHSAGGQLALWAVARAGPDAPVRPRGVVSQAGVVHLPRRTGAEVAAFLGGSWEDLPERYREASPSSNLPIGVPLLLVQGTADAVVPAAMAERFAQGARAAGDEVTLELRAGEDHLAHLNPSGGAWAAVCAWIADLAAPKVDDG